MPNLPTHTEDELSDPEQSLLDEQLDGAGVWLLLRTKTRVDTGSWLRRSRLWLCLTESEVLVFAASQRTFAQRMPLADCLETHYCPTSGALLLQPSDRWRFNTIELSPTDARLVLENLQAAPTPGQTIPPTEPTGA